MVYSKRLIYRLTLPLILYCTTNIVHGDDAHNNNTQSKISKYHLENITLVGTSQQQQKLLQWLNEIAEIEKGRETLLSIINTPHQLVIKHTFDARMSAGRTIAPMTQNLINGKGESILIIFDAEIPEEGTHRVFNKNFDLIEFTATQNLFHELAHAVHQMNGTWRYFDSEGQAIEEENIYRMQESLYKNTKITQRHGKSGFPIGSQEEKRIIAFRLRSQASL